MPHIVIHHQNLTRGYLYKMCAYYNNIINISPQSSADCSALMFLYGDMSGLPDNGGGRVSHQNPPMMHVIVLVWTGMHVHQELMRYLNLYNVMQAGLQGKVSYQRKSLQFAWYYQSSASVGQKCVHCLQTFWHQLGRYFPSSLLPWCLLLAFSSCPCSFLCLNTRFLLKFRCFIFIHLQFCLHFIFCPSG